MVTPFLRPILTRNFPEYRGGMDEFYDRIGHIPYTFYDRMTNHQGLVTIILVVEKDGSISNLKILHGISEKQDKEILRVVKRLNKWTPGTRVMVETRARALLHTH